eukprot:317540_1
MMSALQCYAVILSYTWFYTMCNAITECVNVVGPNSDSYDDAYSSASCAAEYELVSCGIDSTTTANIDGAKIVGSECRAYIGNGAGSSDYVRAIARCCKLHSSAQCSTYTSAKSLTGDDAIATTTCPSNEILTGCSPYTPWRLIDGAKPGPATSGHLDNVSPEWFGGTPLKECTAWNGNGGGGTFANGRCCSYTDSNIELECGYYEGVESGINANDFSDVGCPNGYFLTGCSAHNFWIGVKSWFITDENKCRARTRGSSSKGVWPFSICCREIDLRCDERDEGKTCDTNNDCTDCMQCCKERKVCEMPPITPLGVQDMVNINGDEYGVNPIKKNIYQEPYIYGYILIIG